MDIKLTPAMLDLQRRLSDKLSELILGDGSIGTLKESPPSDALNIETLKNLLADFPPSPPSLRFIEIPPTPIYGPVKRHRRRRIQKKWLKRHGRKIVGWDRPLGDEIIVDERSGNAFCHTDVAARIRHEMAVNGIALTARWPQ